MTRRLLTGLRRRWSRNDLVTTAVNAVCGTIDALDSGPHATAPKTVRWWRHVSGVGGTVSSRNR